MNFKEFLTNEIAIDDSQWRDTQQFVVKMLDEFLAGEQKLETIIRLLESLQHPDLRLAIMRLKTIGKESNSILPKKSLYRIIDHIKVAMHGMPSMVPTMNQPRHSPIPI